MAENVETIQLLITGWIFGVMTCMLYATIGEYVKIKRRNRRHQILLDAGVDPLTILMNDPT